MNVQIPALIILCPTCRWNRGQIKALHSIRIKGNPDKTTIMIFFDCGKSPIPVAGKAECESYLFISVRGRKNQVKFLGVSKPGRPKDW